MTFAEQFIELHRRHYASRHSFSSTSIAFLCLMSQEPSKAWKAADFEREFGLTYPACANIIKRLRLEGFADGSGRITAYGLTSAGVPRPE